NDGAVDSSAATVSITVTSGTPTLSIADSSVPQEGNNGCVNMVQMPFVVTLSAASADTVTVTYQTFNGTASGDATCNPTRSKGYISASGTLTFAPGDTSKTIPIQIVGDTAKE